MRPKDSPVILSTYIVITTAVAFGIGFVIGGKLIALGSAIAALVITGVASIAAREGLSVSKMSVLPRVLDFAILALGIALLGSIVVAWVTGEVVIAIVGVIPLLALIVIRSVIRR